MDEAELRERLREILAEEERPDPDWSRVEALCAELDNRLQAEPDIVCADSVYHFVGDADIRQRKPVYAERQRVLVRAFVETGEMTEHAPSVALPWWSCLLIVAAIAALLVWLLT